MIKNHNSLLCNFGGVFVAAGTLSLAGSLNLPAATVWLDDLDVNLVQQDWGDPHKGKSVDNHELRIGNQSFDRGLGTHAESILYVDLKGAVQTFSASVGVDAEINNPAASIEF